MGKVLNFIKQNLAYIIIALAILAIGLSVTLTLVSGNNDIKIDTNTPVVDPIDEPSDDNPTDNPDQEPTIITFISPIFESASVTDYSDTLVWNSTLSRFNAHKAIDFYATEGTAVLAVWDGTVESVENSLLTGITITIDHGNGLKTVYNSLADGDMVTEGQTVKKGDQIGEVSNTNRQESADGAHLHFEVIENNVKIDPSKYLSLDLK